MKKLILAFILVSGAVMFSFSPLSKDIKQAYDEYWENKYWEKEKPRIAAEKEKEAKEFEENRFVRNFEAGIAGTKAKAEIKIKPQNKNSSLVAVKIKPFPNSPIPKDSRVVFQVWDEDGFKLYSRVLYLNEFTRIVNDSGVVEQAEAQFSAYEVIELFENNKISLGSTDLASKYLRSAELIDPLKSDKAGNDLEKTQWKTVSIPDICTFSIPETLEIQSGNYKEISKNVRENILQIQLSPNRVVAQPAGINSLEKVIKTYCRVIVETEEGEKGDFKELGLPPYNGSYVPYSAAKKLKEGIEQGANISDKLKMKIFDWKHPKVLDVGGGKAILIDYKRSLNGAEPVRVRMYRIMNNDCLHTITTSYRLSEMEIWKDDISNIIKSFEFTKR